MKCVTILYCTLPCSKHDHIVSKFGDEVLPVQLHLVGVGDGELDELGLECSRGCAYSIFTSRMRSSLSAVEGPSMSTYRRRRPRLPVPENFLRRTSFTL